MMLMMMMMMRGGRRRRIVAVAFQSLSLALSLETDRAE
jgi:hypothetical protein